MANASQPNKTQATLQQFGQEKRSKYDVDTFEEADALVWEKSKELDKFYLEILSYFGGDIEIGKIEYYQNVMCDHEREIITLHSSLKGVREKISPTILEQWREANAECNYHSYKIMDMNNRLEKKHDKARTNAERLFIDISAAIIAVTLIPNAAFSWAGQIPYISGYALPVSGAVALFGCYIALNRYPSKFIMMGKEAGRSALLSAELFLGDSDVRPIPKRPCKSALNLNQKMEYKK